MSLTTLHNCEIATISWKRNYWQPSRRLIFFGKIIFLFFSFLLFSNLMILSSYNGEGGQHLYTISGSGQFGFLDSFLPKESYAKNDTSSLAAHKEQLLKSYRSIRNSTTLESHENLTTKWCKFRRRFEEKTPHLQLITPQHITEGMFLKNRSSLFRPELDPLGNEQFRSCAVVSNSGGLLHSNLGNFIDAHDFVVRFNHAPTAGFEEDVGKKTSLRVFNGLIPTQARYEFSTSEKYREGPLLLWDPGHYPNITLEQWVRTPSDPIFGPFFEHRERYPDQEFFLLDPRGLWELRAILAELYDTHSPSTQSVGYFVPSSGFIGWSLLMPHCDYVDVFEFIPSMRKLSRRCHYFEVSDCNTSLEITHPFVSERLLLLSLNEASDEDVFRQGFVRIQGFARSMKSPQCQND